MEIDQTSVQTLEHLFVLRDPLKIQQIWLKLVRVEMPENGTSMKVTHVCMKTYFVKNRSGEVISLTVSALYVNSVNQD